MKKRTLAVLLILSTDIHAATDRQRITVFPPRYSGPTHKAETADIAKFIENRTVKVLRSHLARYFAVTEIPPGDDQAGEIISAQNLGKFRDKSDLIVSGEYTLEGYNLKLRIRIFDIEAGKQVQELDYQGEADSTVDGFIDNVAQDIYSRISELDAVIIAQQRKLHNQISFLAGASFFSSPDSFSDRLQPGVTLYPSDINGMTHLIAEYQLRHLGMQNTILFIQPKIETGKRTVAVQNNEKQIEAQTLAYSGNLGIGYILNFGKSLYLSPLLGGGYYSGIIRLDYSNLEATPFDLTTGKDLRSADINTSAWILRSEIRFGYRLSKHIAIELGIGNTVFFYSGMKPIVLFAQMGIAYAF
ncbi:MAG: hypothetical protein ACOY5B_10455 [Spirochaetota bacterium]